MQDVLCNSGKTASPFESSLADVAIALHRHDVLRTQVYTDWLYLW